jgi:two-component system LytT family response regulator
MRTVVIDDESKSREVLINLLDMTCPELDIVGEAESVKDGIEVIRKTAPRLVFFDIMLKDGDSFQIIRSLNEVKFDMIFVTAFDELALKALTFGGVKCLLKPVDLMELEQAVNEVRSNPLQSFEAYQLADGMIQSKLTAIPFLTNKGIVYRPVSDIEYIKHSPNGSDIHFKDGNLSSDRTIHEFMAILPEGKFVKKEDRIVKSGL